MYYIVNVITVYVWIIKICSSKPYTRGNLTNVEILHTWIPYIRGNLTHVETRV